VESASSAEEFCREEGATGKCQMKCWLIREGDKSRAVSGVSIGQRFGPPKIECGRRAASGRVELTPECHRRRLWNEVKRALGAAETERGQ
jgi:hypothetical protein